MRLAGKAGPIDCLTVLADDASENDRQASETRHRELGQRIADSGGKAGSRIEQGDPSEVIARTGQEGYSLIILGKHGRNWTLHKIIGSTAAKVRNRAPPGPDGAPTVGISDHAKKSIRSAMSTWRR